MRDRICQNPGHEHANLFESLFTYRKWTIEDDKLMLKWLKDNPEGKYGWGSELAKFLKTKTKREIFLRSHDLQVRKNWLTETQKEIKTFCIKMSK